MNVLCSVCRTEKENMNVLESPILPRVRYIACDECQEDSLQPRPLIILAIKYGDATEAKRYIKSRLYLGDEIKAAEIIDLDQ